MGMFTTVIDSKNQEWQIKCGWDECKKYHLGDIIDWYIIENCAGEGYLLDGIYNGFDYRNCKGYNAFIVIQNHQIVDVIEVAGQENFDDENYYELYHLTRDEVYDKYKINEPPKELWSDEVWKEKEEFQLKLQKEQEDLNKEMDEKGLGGFDRMIHVMANSLKRRIDYSSIARKIFKVEPLLGGAVPYYSEEDGYK